MCSLLWTSVAEVSEEILASFFRLKIQKEGKVFRLHKSKLLLGSTIHWQAFRRVFSELSEQDNN